MKTEIIAVGNSMHEESDVVGWSRASCKIATMKYEPVRFFVMFLHHLPQELRVRRISSHEAEMAPLGSSGLSLTPDRDVAKVFFSR